MPSQHRNRQRNRQQNSPSHAPTLTQSVDNLPTLPVDLTLLSNGNGNNQNQNPNPNPYQNPNQNQNQNPATGTSGVSGVTRRRKPQDKYDKLYDKLVTNIGGIGAVFITLGKGTNNPALLADGTTFLNHAETLATDLVQTARTNEAFYKALNWMTEGSAWSTLTIEIGAMGIELAANHGVNVIGEAMQAVQGFWYKVRGINVTMSDVQPEQQQQPVQPIVHIVN